MLLNRISKRTPEAAPKPGQRGLDRERRFEALYMQSFVEMRARSPKG